MTTLVAGPYATSSIFKGLTVEQARIMNSALWGLPVEVAGGQVSHDPAESKVYIFERIVVPGSWATDPFMGVGDLVLWNAEDVGGVLGPCFGSSRVISASLVFHFDVLAASQEWWSCSACGRRLPRTVKRHDIGGLGRDDDGTAFMLRDGDFEWEQRFECGRCW